MGRVSAPSEEQLWSYLVQLTSALRAAHSAGLLLRPAALMPSKILLASPGRIRVGAWHSHSPAGRLSLANLNNTSVPLHLLDHKMWFHLLKCCA